MKNMKNCLNKQRCILSRTIKDGEDVYIVEIDDNGNYLPLTKKIVMNYDDLYVSKKYEYDDITVIKSHVYVLVEEYDKLDSDENIRFEKFKTILINKTKNILR